MKRILLIRHAKSSWDNPSMADFDRKLNERGKQDAPMMARRLLEKNIRPQLIVSSNAKRAKKTAELMQEVWGTENKILLQESLYLAPPNIYETVISDLSDQYDTIALVGHNPGITEFANTLATASIDDMPTCSVFAVKAMTTEWKQFSLAPKNFWFFDYPKNLFPGTQTQ